MADVFLIDGSRIEVAEGDCPVVHALREIANKLERGEISAAGAIVLLDGPGTFLCYTIGVDPLRAVGLTELGKQTVLSRLGG